MKPIIGITASDYQDETYFMTKSDYIHAICLSGGTPVLIPYASDLTECAHVVEKLDGLLIPGGIDVSPPMYGEEPIPEVDLSNRSLDLYEMELIRAAIRQDKPILAICRGFQILNVALGGTLYQDIHAQKAASICHRQNICIRGEMTHSVSLIAGSVFDRIYGREKIFVNSYHHQAVRDLAKNLIPAAYSPDRILEAYASENERIIGVQWHPEALIYSDESTRKLFGYFMKLCRNQEEFKPLPHD